MAMLSTAPTPPAPTGKPNPDYWENWKVAHDAADERRAEASAVRKELMARLHDRLDGDSDRMVAAEAQWEEAHSLCIKCLEVHQHPTFEDALSWVNKTFCARDPISDVDVQEFSEVGQLISATYTKHSRLEWERRARKNVIDVADPLAFAPFADPQTWQVIEPLFNGASVERGTRRQALFATCRVGDTLHVVMQSAGRLLTVINDCEYLIEGYLVKEVPEWTAQGWFTRKPLPKIQFYTYGAPTDMMVEMFDRVDLASPPKPGKPIRISGWSPLGFVPASVRPEWLPGGMAPFARPTEI